ncbi:hypothetical protein L1887_10190 [Cichorium endivia]|nr:hypothetical protein L1887_10190 [Cichorium endivia]
MATKRETSKEEIEGEVEKKRARMEDRLRAIITDIDPFSGFSVLEKLTLLRIHEDLSVLETMVIGYNGVCDRSIPEKRTFDDLLSLFCAFPNAKSLKLFSHIVHVLSLFQHELVKQSSPFRKLKCLELDFRYPWSFESSGNGIPSNVKDYLLRNSPDAKINDDCFNSELGLNIIDSDLPLNITDSDFPSEVLGPIASAHWFFIHFDSDATNDCLIFDCFISDCTEFDRIFRTKLKADHCGELDSGSRGSYSCTGVEESCLVRFHDRGHDESKWALLVVGQSNPLPKAKDINKPPWAFIGLGF